MFVIMYKSTENVLTLLSLIYVVVCCTVDLDLT